MVQMTNTDSSDDEKDVVYTKYHDKRDLILQEAKNSNEVTPPNWRKTKTVTANILSNNLTLSTNTPATTTNLSSLLSVPRFTSFSQGLQSIASLQKKLAEEDDLELTLTDTRCEISEQTSLQPISSLVTTSTSPASITSSSSSSTCFPSVSSSSSSSSFATSTDPSSSSAKEVIDVEDRPLSPELIILESPIQEKRNEQRRTSPRGLGKKVSPAKRPEFVMDEESSHFYASARSNTPSLSSLQDKLKKRNSSVALGNVFALDGEDVKHASSSSSSSSSVPRTTIDKKKKSSFVEDLEDNFFEKYATTKPTIVSKKLQAKRPTRLKEVDLSLAVRKQVKKEHPEQRRPLSHVLASQPVQEEDKAPETRFSFGCSAPAETVIDGFQDEEEIFSQHNQTNYGVMDHESGSNNYRNNNTPNFCSSQSVAFNNTLPPPPSLPSDQPFVLSYNSSYEPSRTHPYEERIGPSCSSSATNAPFPACCSASSSSSIEAPSVSVSSSSSASALPLPSNPHVTPTKPWMKKIMNRGGEGNESQITSSTTSVDSPYFLDPGSGKRRKRATNKHKGGELATRLQRALHRQATEATILSHSSALLDNDSSSSNSFFHLSKSSFVKATTTNEPLLLRILDGRLLSCTYIALCTVCSFPSFANSNTATSSTTTSSSLFTPRYSVKDIVVTYFPNIFPDALTDVPASSLCWVCFDLKQHKDSQLTQNSYINIETPQIIFPSSQTSFALPLITHSSSCICVDAETGLQAEREERAMNRPQPIFSSLLASSSSSTSSSSSSSSSSCTSSITSTTSTTSSLSSSSCSDSPMRPDISSFHLPFINPLFPLFALSSIKSHSNNSRYSVLGMVQKSSLRVKPSASPLSRPSMSFFCLQDYSGCVAIVEIPKDVLDEWKWVMQSGEGEFILMSNMRFRQKKNLSWQPQVLPAHVQSFLKLFNVNEVLWFRATKDTSWSEIPSSSFPLPPLLRYSGFQATTQLPPYASSVDSLTSIPTTTDVASNASDPSTTSHPVSIAVPPPPTPVVFRVTMTCEPVVCLKTNLHVTAISLPPSPLLELSEVNGRSCIVVSIDEVHNLKHCLSTRLQLRDLLVMVSQPPSRMEFVADLYTDIFVAE